MKRPSQITLTLLLFAVSVVCCLPILQIGLNVYDEGIVLAGAERVLRGDVPYRDFWSMYPPGQFYVLAFLFRLFGPSVLVERIYDVVVRALLVTCAFGVVKKLGCSNKVAVVGWGVALAWTAATRFAGYPVYVALLLILVGITLFLHYLQTRRARWLLFCGLSVALSATFRHDLAAMAAAVVGVALVAVKLRGKEAGWRPIAVYLGGIALVGLPIAIYFASVVGVGPVVEQLILTPADVMPRYRWLPYPAFAFYETVHFYLFPVVSVAGLLLSLILLARDRAPTPFTYGMLVLSLTGILFINQVRVRSDTIHLFPNALLSIVVAPGLFSYLFSRRAWGARVAAIVLVVGMGVLLGGLARERFEALGEPYWVEPSRSAIDRAGYARSGQDLADVVSFVRDNTAEGEAIYVGVTNHDRLLINHVMVYFLAGRAYGSKYHELHPGVTNTLSVQQEIVRELQAAPVRLIVLHEGYWQEPNQTEIDAQIDLLDRTIEANYRLVRRFGGYQVWFARP